MSELSDIKAYEPVHNRLATSGLPEERHFSIIKEHGYEFVISLCTPGDDIVLEDEDRFVVGAGMNYIHFPVDINRPSIENYELLRDQLNLLMDRKVWLHCTYNYRVSAMVYLYNILERGVESTSARIILEKTWHPSGEWEHMIELALEKYVYQYL